MNLKEELEILRGEPIEEFPCKPEDVPCIETSDLENLCKHPVVSVSMITYNHEHYIRQAIESVMMQKTDFEFELVIGEDCSQDKTREICFEYQKKYPDKIRVLWWHENVSKLGGNNRRCRAHCRGEFVAFCEGDDYWIDPLKLQKQVDVMRRHPNVGFCFCGAVDYQQSSGLSTDYNICGDIPVGVIIGRDFLSMNLFGRGVPAELRRESYVRTATAMVRCVDVHKAARKNEILNWWLRLGDVPVWLSIASVADVYFLPDQTATYRQNNGGACARLGAVLWKDNLLVRIFFLFKWFDGVKVTFLQREYFNALIMSNYKSGAVKSYFDYFHKLKSLDRVSSFVDSSLWPWMIRSLPRWVMYYLRYECEVVKPFAKFYRRILGHGEFAG